MVSNQPKAYDTVKNNSPLHSYNSSKGAWGNYNSSPSTFCLKKKDAANIHFQLELYIAFLKPNYKCSPAAST